MAALLRAYISAPLASDLGALPKILEVHSVDWEWANSPATSGTSPADAIERADLFIGVLTGVREDKRVLFETGVAAGLRKRILVLRTTAKVWPTDVLGIKSARLRLNDREALHLHIDALLASPADSIFQRSIHPDLKPSNVVAPEQKPIRPGHSYEAQIAARLADVIARAGGSALHEPEGKSGTSKFRPDMLIWLGNQDPQLLDPAAVEIRRRLDPESLKSLADRMIGFMQATGVRSSIIVSESQILPTVAFRWPTIFSLSLDEFENLVEQGALGRFLREKRNKAMHAAS